MKKQLQQLGEVSNMILDLKLADLQTVAQQIGALQAENHKVRQDQERRAHELGQTETPDLAQYAGQDERWNAWVQTKIKARNIELAKLSAEREDRMAAARTAMGRAEVIKSLLRKNRS
ncbi:hypothetical protein K3X41_12995 [Aliiroseovarius crassostreae]|uniref:hypothetical protein n=1 Tax=Aliiroseovarius crassostreae TaxID=154981 RepID=UPI0021F985B9|nr:hypothetical protein [Aliiroseovarius crassostreae]UWQ10777.1 hypothetical protein K3X41_12995 [Aliiroseovarius crassostreae]